MALLSGVVGPLASSFDRLVSRAITGRSAASRRSSRAESLGHAERVVALRGIQATYAAAGDLEDTAAFFGEVEPVDLELTEVGTLALERGRAKITDVRWASRVQTFSPELGERFAAVRQNHRAAARLFRGPGERRPVAMLVHGYRGGRYSFTERVWPVRWMLDHGMDVALFVLPFHAVRAEPGAPPRFPSSDPRFTNEAFRQAVADLRNLLHHLRDSGAPSVGAMGMSLGGYTVSLLGTVEPRLDFLAPIIPLSSFADVALAAGRLVGSPEEQLEQHAGLEAAHRVVSPFARSPKVPKEAVVVVAGQADRITPISHAEKIARHYGVDLVTFHGGHLLQFGRSSGFRAVGRMLRSRGLFR